MSRPLQASDSAGNLIQYLHEEAMNQQHILDTWQFATALAGRHRADPRPEIDRHEDFVPHDYHPWGTSRAMTTEAGRPRRIRRFLDGAGEPETLNTRTEFTRD